MSDKWNGKQKGDAEFKPPAPPKKEPEPPPGTLTKATLDRWVEEYRPLLDGPGRRYRPGYDLDFRPRYKPSYETATEKRELEREWERNGGRLRMREMERAIEEDMRRKYEMLALYSKPMFQHGKVIAQRIIIYDAEGQARLQMDVPSEKQSKLAELFDKAAQVPGYMHWWAESEPERMAQTRDAAREIVGALRYDADYWKPAYPDVFDFACFIAQGIVAVEASKIKVETIREPPKDTAYWLGSVVS